MATKKRDERCLAVLKASGYRLLVVRQREIGDTELLKQRLSAFLAPGGLRK
ncbi:MAG: hypothetical protein LBQ51_05830 [Desulfovibrio sp.]|jgi:hypothetical protein|nr:hypothetical protein [Desulfovibrio sp.]